MGTKAFRASVSRQDRKSASRQPRLVVSGCKNRCFSPVLEPERLRSGAAEAERTTERLRGVFWRTSDKCGKQARWWESGVKSYYKAEHRSPPGSPSPPCSIRSTLDLFLLYSVEDLVGIILSKRLLCLLLALSVCCSL